MNKQTAIKVLETQKKKLDSFHEKRFYDLVWKTQTMQYIKQIFGENSEQFSYINRLKIHSQYSPDPSRFLDSCIDSVTNVGVFKEHKKNILDGYSDLKLISIAISIFIAGFSAGIWLNDRGIISFNRTVIVPNNISQQQPK